MPDPGCRIFVALEILSIRRAEVIVRRSRRDAVGLRKAHRDRRSNLFNVTAIQADGVVAISDAISLPWRWGLDRRCTCLCARIASSVANKLMFSLEILAQPPRNDGGGAIATLPQREGHCEEVAPRCRWLTKRSARLTKQAFQCYSDRNRKQLSHIDTSRIYIVP